MVVIGVAASFLVAIASEMAIKALRNKVLSWKHEGYYAGLNLK